MLVVRSVINECKVESICAARVPESANEGKRLYIGTLKSIPCANVNIFIDSLTRSGTEIISKARIITISKSVIIVAHKFLDLIFLWIKLYRGEKTNTRTNPNIIDIKIGFNNKKERTINVIDTAATIRFVS
jgi:hypothetical protein